ncbi:MAG TPA: MG2 domain-containing protein [Bacteroidales bacterium]|nr:MG2 domain-containing protein [Bacteroidales bacterium]HSA42717.1 MG2 domain-containing protein [Bacteroidales bacterium]
MLSLFKKPLKAVLCLAVFLTACQKPSKTPLPLVDIGFAPYIAAFTSGSVSKESSVRIRLAQDYAGAVINGSEVKEKIFRFKPDIPGKLYWSDTRTLEFKPDKPLEEGRAYLADFCLYKLIDVPEKYRTFTFQFQVIAQSFSVETEELLIPENGNKAIYRLEGILRTADVADPPDVEQILTARIHKKTLRIDWNHETGGKTHRFFLDSIPRGENRNEIKLSWNGNPIQVDLQGERNIVVPALGEFTVLGYRIINDDEPCIGISFSDPPDPMQVLKGLIRFNQWYNPALITSGNVIRVYPKNRYGSKATLYVENSIRNTEGKTLDKPFSAEISFDEGKPAVRLIGSGVILPASSGLILPFEAIGLSKVDVRIIKIYGDNVAQFLQVNDMPEENELKRVGRPVHREQVNLLTEAGSDPVAWHTHFLDLKPLIDPDPGAIYHVIISFRKEYSLYPCDQQDHDAEMAEVTDYSEAMEAEDRYYQDAEWYYYDYYPEGYRWDQRDNPCHVSYYNQERFVSRNILASDLGIIAKADEQNNWTVAVSDLITTESVGDVEVEVFNYQRQLVGSGKTNADGLARFKASQKPFLLIARKNRQRAYLRLDNGSSLSLSQFDVSGAEKQKGLKGFIYGERGVWRPGDTLFLAFILEDELKTLPDKHPVILEIMDSQGKTRNKLLENKQVDGFYRFTVPTADNVPTGNWTATVRVGGATFSKNIKIETVKPNRLKINLDFSEKVLDIHQPVHAALQLHWLTGARASGLRGLVTASFSATKTVFPAYRNFVFDDPLKKFWTEEHLLFDGKVDQEGKATFTKQISIGNSAPGMLQAAITVRAFEEGGDASQDYFTMPVSTYKTYVGLKVPPGDKESGMLQTDKDITVEVVACNAGGNLVRAEKLEVTVHKVKWRWWWNASDNDLASYEGDMENLPVYKNTLTLANGKGSFRFRINYPEWGRYLVSVRDPEGGHAAGQSVYIDWPYWRSRDRKQQAESASILNFSSDKNEYQAGEEAVLTIPGTSGGRALVSIETGSGILDAWWVKTKDKETVVKIRMTDKMSPNVYVHVSLVQPHAQTINDNPVRMYGVIPLLVTDPATRLSPIIQAAEVIRPDETTRITVGEKQGKAMTYTLAIVDEGLLDLTRFKTPDPWSHFYAREALGVKTWDMYNLVIGAYGGKFGQAFAIGGDRDQQIHNPKKANRFKPVVTFLGPFRLAKGKTGTHQVKIPNYVGSVRVMVIAGSQGAFGSADKRIPVRKPLMVLPSLPRVLCPGETVKLPVTVFALEKQIRNVKLNITTNPLFTIKGRNTINLNFSGEGDQVVYFELLVKEAVGTGKIQLHAESGNEKASSEVEMEIRNPNPVQRISWDHILKPGESWINEHDFFGLAGTSSATLEVSTLFPPDFDKRLAWLIEYPYGCLEQITSAAFPQLFLADISELNQGNLARIADHVNTCIQKLRTYQLPSGGFASWPGAFQCNDWISNFAGHFMLEAENHGYAVPYTMKQAWIKYQVQASRMWMPGNKHAQSYGSAWDFVQAYRLYTLVLAKQPQLPSMNRLREQKSLDAPTRFRLAAAYALAGYSDQARNLIIRASDHSAPAPDTWQTYGSPLRDQAMILETYVLMNETNESARLAREIAATLATDSWLNTHATAWSLVALGKFIGKTGRQAAGNMQFAVNPQGKSKTEVKTDKKLWKGDLPVKSGKGRVTITNTGRANLYAQVVVSGQPLTGEFTRTGSKLGLQVRYKDKQGNPLDITKLKQGTDFRAEFTVSYQGLAGYQKDLALTTVFPSGWEIINPRMGGQAAVDERDLPDYQDYRDDRVYTHFELGPGTSKTFVILLNASFPGRFYMAGPMCEAMYDNGVYASLPGRWVEVLTQ